MSMNELSSLCSSFDDTQYEEEFLAFKEQLLKVQGLVDKYNNKIIEKTLCQADLVEMSESMKYMTELEQLVTKEKMKSSYVSYKTLSLKMIQESYRICNWLMEKHCDEMDNVFTIDSFMDKVIEATRGKDPLDHLKTLFAGVYKNTMYMNINFCGNIKPVGTAVDKPELVQPKKEIKRSQKRVLETQVIPDEVQDDSGDNELQITLLRITKCLKFAVSNNENQPICFYKFAIDPFSLTYTVENLFNLASLVKDNLIIIDSDKNGHFTTIIDNQKPEKVNKDNLVSTLFKINHELWQYYIKKYNITERMIEQDREE
ncbi:Non-structural maintenance of chromosome element 4, C-terminal [Cinara cedri]|uniref:Non-structural maintenance of chromosomes element 4 n=1 Tax=Cinara cedri TaxID=506608 RepID=A0A5E4LYY9_9HEMI|nr:Non-structural maintenance of chromosome element 4, C-terminal [Cinara cedri]